MGGVRAWELLHDPEYAARLQTSDFYDLLIRAGYSQEVAQKAALEHGWERLTAGEVM